ncbi:MAG: hypothetical protein LC114_27155 [Bryobacterales bacterium]|nr:hypothetical protein [Bryobacterales bacterium]
MSIRSIFLAGMLAIGCATAGAVVDYRGPKPPKPDVPYLVHGDQLVETDQAEATQSEEKKRTVYTTPGASATARTPLAEPIFLIRPEKLKAEQLSLYQMKVEKGNRQVSFGVKPGKDDSQPIPLLFDERKDGTVIIEANKYLENGEYCLSPSGANTVFCFQVY